MLKDLFTYPLKKYSFVNLLVFFLVILLLNILKTVVLNMGILSASYMTIPIIIIEIIVYIFAFDYLNQVAGRTICTDEITAPEWKINRIDISEILSKSLILIISILECALITLLSRFLLKFVNIDILPALSQSIIAALFFSIANTNIIVLNTVNSYNIFHPVLYKKPKAIFLSIIIYTICGGITLLGIANINALLTSLIFTTVFYLLQINIFHSVRELKPYTADHSISEIEIS